MTARATLPQLKRYDITQRVVEALADAEARAILFSSVRRGRTATELSEALRIPLSSVYKKLADLSELALVEVERIELTDRGRRLKVYRSRISKADITIQRPEPSLDLAPN